MTAFQFHKGTIRTVQGALPLRPQFLFQFHKGTIRTNTQSGESTIGQTFQFHTGTIRTQDGSFKYKDYLISIP